MPILTYESRKKQKEIMYIRGYNGDSPEEKIEFNKYMVVKYTVEFNGEISEDKCFHAISEYDEDGTCLDSDEEILESIKYDTLGNILSWEFLGYRN